MRELDTDRKDWREHLWKIVTHGGKGTRVVYWTGQTDVDPAPSSKRYEVFNEVRGYGDLLHLTQRRVDVALGVYQYEFTVA